MNRVALSADHVIQRMGRVADIRAGKSFGVTAQARIQDLLGRELRKGNDGCFAAVSRDMQLSRPMTTLASGIGRPFLSGGNALEVSILVKPEPDVRMARLTNHASDISVLRGIGG